jgi:hypothetical protein
VRINQNQGFLANTFSMFNYGIILAGDWCGVEDLMNKQKTYTKSAQ